MNPDDALKNLLVQMAIVLDALAWDAGMSAEERKPLIDAITAVDPEVDF